MERALQNGANPNYVNNEDEDSPFALHETVKIKDDVIGMTCTKVLLDRGADVNLRTLATKNTPLHEGNKQCYYALMEDFQMLNSVFVSHSCFTWS